MQMLSGGSRGDARGTAQHQPDQYDQVESQEGASSQQMPNQQMEGEQADNNQFASAPPSDEIPF